MANEIAGQFSAARPVILDGDRPVFQSTKDATLIANGSGYQVVAASQSGISLGASGAVGDFLAGILIVPGTTAAGAVSIADGNGSSITIFAGGGTTALVTLIPFFVPIGAKCTAATTPGWKITTGANVTAIAVGSFT